MVCSASVRDREHLQDLRRELPGSRSPMQHHGGSSGYCRRSFGVNTVTVRDYGRAKAEGEPMSKQIRVSHPLYNFLPTEIEGFDSLAELALDLHWSWNHATDEVWRTLDPILWEITHNPWVILQTVSRDQLESVLADSVFRKNVDALARARRQALETPAWFQEKHPQASLTCIAYFSMEFM